MLHWSYTLIQGSCILTQGRCFLTQGCYINELYLDTISELYLDPRELYLDIGKVYLDTGAISISFILT